ncbi:MAG: cytochrome c [Thiohalorhabdus sp.]|uniref:cytochrome c n=1 Tax=Thiohalorhabdus sp. TaxID=3094134 RepID=UPI0039816927
MPKPPSRGRPRILLPLLLMALATAPATGGAESQAVTEDLTPKLDRLLREEMQAIQESMATAFAALVTGDHDTVAEEARGIHDSFILKRSLTEEDRRDLREAVPEGFVRLDQRFHAAAAELAEVAEEGDADRQLEVYNRMTRDCVACHSRYVTGRFPGLEGAD